MRGYSLIEIVVVVVIIMILMAMALPQLVNFKKRYKSEDQAIKVMDLMREASQLALTKRRVIRFELDRSDTTRTVVRLIDENGSGAADDVLLKTVPLEPMSEVRMDAAPDGVSVPAPPNYPEAVFASNVWSVSFTNTGTVVSPGGTPVSATIYSWPPKSVPWDPNDLTPRSMFEVRAITIYGGSGAVRFWKHDGTAFVPYQ